MQKNPTSNTDSLHGVCLLFYFTSTVVDSIEHLLECIVKVAHRVGVLLVPRSVLAGAAKRAPFVHVVDKDERVEGKPELLNLRLCLGTGDDEPSRTKEQKYYLGRSKTEYEARKERILVGGVGVVVVVEFAELYRDRQACACDNVLYAKIRETDPKAGLLKNVHYRSTGQASIGGSLCASADNISRSKDKRSCPWLRQADGRGSYSMEAIRFGLENRSEYFLFLYLPNL